MARRSWIGTCLLLGTSVLWAQTNDPLIAPMAPPNAIPEGATFLVRLEDKLDTTNLRQGKRFKVKLGEDLIAANGRRIPRGKKIRGHVSAVSRGLHDRLLLSFDEIETDHGWVPLAATVTGVPSEHGLKPIEGEGEIERKSVSKGRMIESAVMGGMFGDRDLLLDKGTTLEVRLDHHLQIPSH